MKEDSSRFLHLKVIFLGVFCVIWIVLCDFRVNVTLDYNLNIVFRRLVHKVSSSTAVDCQSLVKDSTYNMH